MVFSDLPQMLGQGSAFVVGAATVVYVVSYLLAAGVAILHKDRERRADARKVLSGNPFTRITHRRSR